MNLTTNLMLFKAVSDSNKEVIEFLIAAGADVNFIVPEWFIKEIDYLPVIPSEDFTFSPLHVAIINNNIEAIKILKKNGANVNQSVCKSIYLSPIILALGKNYNANTKPFRFEITKILVEAQAKINDYKDSSDYKNKWATESIARHLPWMKHFYGPPLEIAYRLNDYELIKLLIDFGANYNIKLTDRVDIRPQNLTVNQGDTFHSISQRLFGTTIYADFVASSLRYSISQPLLPGTVLSFPDVSMSREDKFISKIIKDKNNKILKLILGLIYLDKNKTIVSVNDFLKTADYYPRYIDNPSADMYVLKHLLKFYSYYKVYFNIQVPEILIDFIVTYKPRFMFDDTFCQRINTTDINDNKPSNNCLDFFITQNEDELVKILLEQTISSSRSPRTALDTNDCFFDSIAKSLADIGKKGYSAKSLRKICYDYVVNLNKGSKDNNWIYHYFLSDALRLNPSDESTAMRIASKRYQQYLSNIRYIEAEIKDGQGLNINNAIPGNSVIEGRILCEQLEIKLHLIELLNFEQGYTLTHRLDNRAISNIDSVYPTFRTSVASFYN